MFTTVEGANVKNVFRRLALPFILTSALAIPAGVVSAVTAASASTYCASSPHLCGFPDGTNTGYGVDGVSLSQMQVHHGSWTVTTPGKVLSNIDTDGPIIVEASGVTIKDVRIKGNLPNSPGIELEPGANNTTIENSVIRGNDTTSSGALELAVKDMQGTPVTGTVVDHVNVYDTGGGFQLYQGLIENSYVHTMTDVNGWHVEAYNSTGNGGYRVDINHNTLLNSIAQTAAIYEGADFSPSQNIHADNNLLAGGGYTVYGGASGVGPHANPSDITFTNNIFSKIYFPSYGRYGPDGYFNPSAPGDQWNNNRDDNGTSTGGAIINP